MQSKEEMQPLLDWVPWLLIQNLSYKCKTSSVFIEQIVFKWGLKTCYIFGLSYHLLKQWIRMLLVSPVPNLTLFDQLMFLINDFSIIDTGHFANGRLVTSLLASGVLDTGLRDTGSLETGMLASSLPGNWPARLGQFNYNSQQLNSLLTSSLLESDLLNTGLLVIGMLASSLLVAILLATGQAFFLSFSLWILPEISIHFLRLAL